MTMKMPERGTNDDFDKIMYRYQELVDLPSRTAEQDAELSFVIQSYLEFMVRYDPEGFFKEFGMFQVSEEEFKDITGIDLDIDRKKQ